MMTKVLLVVGLIELSTIGSWCMDFSRIVSDNLNNPKKIVENLQKMEESSEVARAFISVFGGENFQSTGKLEGYSQETMDKVKSAALEIGTSLMRSGREDINSIDDLVAAKTFLTFAIERKNNGRKFIDKAVSSSILLDMLEDMIDSRSRFMDSVDQVHKNLKRKKEEVKDSTDAAFCEGLTESFLEEEL